MSFPKSFRRELEVALSKSAQPSWFRVLKYLVLGALIYLFGASTLFWIALSIVLFLALCLHFWYRYKTAGWTKSFGGWDIEKNRSKLGR